MFSKKEIKQALVKKGFKLVQTTNHTHFIFHTKDKKGKRIVTLISRGTQSISKVILSLMAKQTRLKNKEFENLVSCHLSEEGYIQVLKDSDIIL